MTSVITELIYVSTFQDGLQDYINNNRNSISNLVFNSIIDKKELSESYQLLYIFSITESRFILPSIELYTLTSDTILRKDIIFYLISLFYTDDNFKQELIDNGFIKCLSIYIHDWDMFLRSQFGILSTENTSEINIVFSMIKLYIQYNLEYNTDTMNIYHSIFAVCANMSFNNMNDAEMIHVAKTMYFKYPDESQLHNEIIFFLSNIYLDNDADTYIPDFDVYAIHFISKYYTMPAYDNTIMDIFEIYKPNPDNYYNVNLINIAIKFLNDNLHISKNYNRISKYFLTIADNKDCSDYISTHPLVKRMVQYCMQTDTHLFNLSRVFCGFASNVDTEIPCQFYYNYFIVPIVELQREVYPRYNLFALSNILAVQDNYQFVDMHIVTKYLSTIFKSYHDDLGLFVELYHNIVNLYEAKHLVYCLQEQEFVDSFIIWINELGDSFNHYTHDIIKYMCKTISMHDDLMYLFNTGLGTSLCTVIHYWSDDEIRDDIERYMNNTLQQKCALILYKKNMIHLRELEELDVRLFIVA